MKSRLSEIAITVGILVVLSAMIAVSVQTLAGWRLRSKSVGAMLSPLGHVIFTTLALLPGVYTLFLFCGVRPVFSSGSVDVSLLLTFGAAMALLVVQWLAISDSARVRLLCEGVESRKAVRSLRALSLYLLLLGLVASILTLMEPGG